MAKISTTTRLLALAGTACLLESCGGGGGSGPVSAPAPISPPSPSPSASPSPSPAPSPAPTPFMPVAADLYPGQPTKSVDTNIGVAFTSTPTVTGNALAAAQISYDTASGTYRVALPDGAEGTLTQQGPAFTNGTLGGTGYIPVTIKVPVIGTVAEGYALPTGPQRYTYVSLLNWSAKDEWSRTYQEYYGVTVAAQRTSAPLTGNATYSVDAFGYQAGGPLESLAGKGTFVFDFAAGSVDGQLQVFQTTWGGVGRSYDYALRQGRVSRALGLDGFSAALALTTTVATAPPAGIPSDLQGAFAGPGGAEIFGQFQIPFLADDVKWMPFAGVFMGKR